MTNHDIRVRDLVAHAYEHAPAVRRIMDDAGVDTLIATQLAGEVDSTSVRLAAISASSVRRPSEQLLKAIVERAQHDTSPSVRHSSISLLGDWSREAPSVTAVLTNIAEKDADNDVRIAARNALGS